MELTKTKILKFIVCSLTYRFNETVLGGRNIHIYNNILGCGNLCTAKSQIFKTKEFTWFSEVNYFQCKKCKTFLPRAFSATTAVNISDRVLDWEYQEEICLIFWSKRSPGWR